MDGIEFRKLETEEEIIEYEKRLYEAFKTKHPDNWIFSHYEIIDNCRIRPRNIPRRDQVFYAAVKNGKILAGICGNRNSGAPLQLEEMGFTIDRTGPKFIEGLNLYAAENLGFDAISVFQQIFSFAAVLLRADEVKQIYSTCSAHLLKMYKFFGYESVDCKVLDGVEKHLIKYDIPERL